MATRYTPLFMRLWSLHPRHLDAKGLVAVWREALLAQAVLAGKTRGYRHHPQLERFRASEQPLPAIRAFLVGVADEAAARGYRFDRSRIGRGAVAPPGSIAVTRGQVRSEREHLAAKLAARAPADAERLAAAKRIAVHPLFRVVPGPVEPWEKAPSA